MWKLQLRELMKLTSIMYWRSPGDRISNKQLCILTEQHLTAAGVSSHCCQVQWSAPCHKSIQAALQHWLVLQATTKLTCTNLVLAYVPRSSWMSTLVIQLPRRATASRWPWNAYNIQNTSVTRFNLALSALRSTITLEQMPTAYIDEHTHKEPTKNYKNYFSLQHEVVSEINVAWTWSNHC